MHFFFTAVSFIHFAALLKFVWDVLQCSY